MQEPLLCVRGLSVSLRGGPPIFQGLDLDVAAGQVAAVISPTDADRTALVGALLSPDRLVERGYRVAWSAREIHGGAAYVPRNGALLDHLDVARNVALAYAARGAKADVARVLATAGLAAPGTTAKQKVNKLGVAEARKVALARALASGRKVIAVDEPTAGLDPVSGKELATALVRASRAQNLGLLVITHDLALASETADAVYVLSPTTGRLFYLRSSDPGGVEPVRPEAQPGRHKRLTAEAHELLSQEHAQSHPPRPARKVIGPHPVRVAGAAVLNALRPRLMFASARVFARTLVLALLAPLLLYAAVGALLGFAVLDVVAGMSAGPHPAAALRALAAPVVVALTPALSALLFVAASGTIVAAWLRSMHSGEQLLALEGIGVRVERHLWSPAWLALVASYLVSAAAFGGGMALGAWTLFALRGGTGGWAALATMFVAPRPTQVPFLVRGVWLVGTYAVGVASIVAARGAVQHDTARQAAASVGGAVMRVTLFVIAAELASALALHAGWGR